MVHLIFLIIVTVTASFAGDVAALRRVYAQHAHPLRLRIYVSGHLYECSVNCVGVFSDFGSLHPLIRG